MIAKACDIVSFSGVAVCHKPGDVSLISRCCRVRQSWQFHAAGDIQRNLVIKAPIEIDQHCLSVGNNEFQFKNPVISYALAQPLCLLGKKGVDKSWFKAKPYP